MFWHCFAKVTFRASCYFLTCYIVLYHFLLFFLMCVKHYNFCKQVGSLERRNQKSCRQPACRWPPRRLWEVPAKRRRARSRSPSALEWWLLRSSALPDWPRSTHALLSRVPAASRRSARSCPHSPRAPTYSRSTPARPNSTMRSRASTSASQSSPLVSSLAGDLQSVRIYLLSVFWSCLMTFFILL